MQSAWRGHPSIHYTHLGQTSALPPAPRPSSSPLLTQESLLPRPYTHSIPDHQCASKCVQIFSSLSQYHKQITNTLLHLLPSTSSWKRFLISPNSTRSLFMTALNSITRANRVFSKFPIDGEAFYLHTVSNHTEQDQFLEVEFLWVQGHTHICNTAAQAVPIYTPSGNACHVCECLFPHHLQIQLLSNWLSINFIQILHSYRLVSSWPSSSSLKKYLWGAHSMERGRGSWIQRTSRTHAWNEQELNVSRGEGKTVSNKGEVSLEEVKADPGSTGHTFGQRKESTSTENPTTWWMGTSVRRGRRCSSGSSRSDKAGP